MLTPVTSLGSRSGVNWMRRTVAAIDAANALASIVFPTPGTSSRSRCPSASSTTSAVRTTSDLPSMTVSTAARIASATEATASTSGSAAGSGRGTRDSAGSVAMDNLPAGAGALPVCAENRAAGDRAPRSSQPPTNRNSSRSVRMILRDALGEGVAGQFHPVVQLQFVQGVLDVVLHGAMRQGEPGGDLLAGQPGRDEAQHLRLALGQAGRCGGGGRGRGGQPAVL